MLVFGLNVPVPLLDHTPVPLVAEPLIVTKGALAQTVIDFTAPPVANGSGVMVMVMESFAVDEPQTPLPVTDKYNSIICAAVSALLKV